MTIQNITELFALEGPLFITESYRNLLQHEPDVQGMAYYLGRLAQGHSKESVIYQLARSDECRPHQEILGLEALVKAERRAQHWFWGRVDRIARMKREIQELRLALAAQQAQSQQSAEASAALSRDTIRYAYLAVLEREPESEAVISHHAQVGNVEALYQALLSSEEYRFRIAGASTANSLTEETVRHAYRAVLGREPESEQTINNSLQAEGGLTGLYRTLLSSEEFQQRISRRQDEPSSYLPAASQQLGAHARQIYQDLESYIQKKNLEAA